MTTYTTSTLLEEFLLNVIRPEAGPNLADDISKLAEVLAGQNDWLATLTHDTILGSTKVGDAWSQGSVDYSFEQMTPRLADAITRLQNVIAHADLQAFPTFDTTPYTVAIALVLEQDLESSFDITEFSRPAFAKTVEPTFAKWGLAYTNAPLKRRQQIRKKPDPRPWYKFW